MSSHKGADEGLAKEQLFRLNKEFYTGYHASYFLNRLQELTVKVFKSQEYVNKLSGMKFEGENIKCEIDFEDASELEKTSRIELLELHTHCLESFLRLLIARMKKGDCDWLELSRINTKKFHMYMDGLRQGDFSKIVKDISSELAIQYALTGISQPTKECSPEVLANWKEWVVYGAYLLSDVKDYNAFKHGFAIHSTKSDVSFKPDGADDFIGKNGDAVKYLHRNTTEERTVWQITTKFLDLEIMCAEIFLYANLINNMIIVGRYQYAQIEMKDRWYPNEAFTVELIHKHDFSDIAGIFAAISSYSIPLLYYADNNNPA